MIKFNKIYVVLFLFLVGIRMVTMADNLHLLLYLAMIAIEVLTVVGLFGQAFQKYFFGPLFWKIFVTILVAWESFLIYELGIDNIRLVLIFTGLLLPAYIYIYIYGYKTNWDVKESLAREKKKKKGESDDSDRSSS